MAKIIRRTPDLNKFDNRFVILSKYLQHPIFLYDMFTKLTFIIELDATEEFHEYWGKTDSQWMQWLDSQKAYE